MPNRQDVIWFKSQFQPQIEVAIAGTPLSVDMITAFACQETGEIWGALRRQGLPTSRILELCVGDTIDASPTGGGRRAFPKNKAELLQAPDGDRVFAIARQGLVDMASYIPAYRGAAARPDKFCHGFGIFQLDLQFCRSEPDYFLGRRYADFDVALARCVGELKAALKRIGWERRASLDDAEMAAVAIAYNTGRYDPAKGLRQGYFDGAKYYGENYLAYLQLAKSVRFPAAEPERSRDARELPAQARAKVTAGAFRRQTARTAKAAKTAKTKATRPAKTKTKTRATKKIAGKATPMKTAKGRAAKATHATRTTAKAARPKVARTPAATVAKKAKVGVKKTAKKAAKKAATKAAKKAPRRR